MQTLIPAILIIASIGLFVGFVDPTYQEIKVLKADVRSLNEALDKSNELKKIRDDLRDRYATFSDEDIKRLIRLVPDNVDNIRLILEIDNIAARYGLVIKNVSVDSGAVSNNKSFAPDSTPYGTVTLSFGVTAKYEVMKKFLQDLEDSLRIVDITDIKFNAGDREFTDYSITLNTYWLK